jgi:hypothetical protein
MRRLLLTLAVSLFLSACVSSRTVAVSTDLREMERCEFVGTIKTSLPSHPKFQVIASRAGLEDLAKEKAAQRGATHIVFEDRGERIPAKAYRCPKGPVTQFAP